MSIKLVMTYSLVERSLYNRENNTSIKGSWLYELAKKHIPNDTDNHISLIGLDALKRIEIKVSLYLFEILRHDPVFIMNAGNLRRLRTETNSNTKASNILDVICYPTLRHFDNDLDAVQLSLNDN